MIPGLPFLERTITEILAHGNYRPPGKYTVVNLHPAVTCSPYNCLYNLIQQGNPVTATLGNDLSSALNRGQK